MAAGGKRPGAGRPKGSTNKASRELQEQFASPGVMPLEFLIGIMRDPAEDQAKRIDAAKAAAPYVHARLAAVEHSGGMTLTHEAWLESLGD